MGLSGSRLLSAGGRPPATLQRAHHHPMPKPNQEPAMKPEDLCQQILAAKSHHGAPSKKLSGAATVEVLRTWLQARGLNVSPRDCYIYGVPLEVDLLVLRPGATGHLNLIFQPEDILCALEVKNSGAYGERTCEIVRENFNLIREACQRATCAYIALSEQANYKHAVTPQNLGYPAYTLLATTGRGDRKSYSSTGDWHEFNRFLDGLRES